MFEKEKSLFQLLQQKNQYFTGQDSLQSGPAQTSGILEKWNDDDKKATCDPELEVHQGDADTLRGG